MTQDHEQGTNATLVAVRNGPGARLRAAREANGFTQLEVAQQLRLSAEMIARLEEDNYDPNMPLVFVKGYLRSYAGIIGLDPEQIIAEFGHLGIKDPVRDVPDLAQSPQRKLANFNAGTPKNRPGLLWGSLAVFASVMIALMFMYRDQIPALSTPESTTTVSTSTSTEEAELNAAIESARNANAQTTPASDATQPATTSPDAAASTSNATTSASQTPAPATTATVIAPIKKEPVPSQDEDEDDARPMKPVSANTVQSSSKPRANKTHETMLF